MKEMIKTAWTMFTEKEKYNLYLQRVGTEEDFYNLVEPDFDLNNYKSAEEIYKTVKEELL